MSNDNGWLDQMIEQEPEASTRWQEGDAVEPTGDARDANQLYADMLADPDESADPYRQDTTAGGAQ